MKKLLSLLFVLLLSSGFSQINDDLRKGSTKKKGAASTSSSGSSSGGSSGTSGGGVSANDIGLIIDLCGCLYDVGLAFASEVMIKGIRKNTELIRERRDSFPRIKNMELSLSYGVYPDEYTTYIPRLRLQAGVMGTSFRSYVIQDRGNPFFTDLVAFHDWQVLEFNVLNTQLATLRFGGGFTFEKLGGQLQTTADVTAGTDFYFADDKFKLAIEGRHTPFGEIKTRSEVNSRFYFRPSDRPRFHFEVFVGGNYAKYFQQTDIWSIEVGTGFMLY